jgi:hypothetical protein
MSEQIKGKFEVQNSNGSGTAVMLNGDALPSIGKGLGIATQEKPTVGGKPARPQPPSFLTGQLDIKDSSGKVVMSLGISELTFQGKNVLRSGFIGLTRDGSDANNIELNGSGFINVRGAGLISVTGNTDEKRIELNAAERSLTIHSGALAGKQIAQIKLDATSGVITNGLMKLMANGEIEIPGSMRLEKGRMRLGAEPDGQGNDGALLIRNSDGTVVIELDAAGRKVHILDNLILENGGLRLGSEPGTNGQNGMLFLNNAAGKETVRLDGKAGDLILQNADCAEDFDIASEEAVAAGTVMVLDDDGNLCSSNHAYDKRVAGVISGAGNYRPGIVLDRQPGESTRQPIALMGKVFCKVDARHAPITVGDLLTTSPTPGHAMKALDPIQAFGAVLGKALKPLTDGVGLIPILVSLQ